MKKMSVVFAVVALLTATNSQCFAGVPQIKNLTTLIPVIKNKEVQPNTSNTYDKVVDVAHYGGADWSNVVGISKKVTVQEAKKIADSNPAITYFFYVKGLQMVLKSPDGNVRAFRNGDAVFFSGKPHWGSAHDLADGFVKKSIQ